MSQSSEDVQVKDPAELGLPIKRGALTRHIDPEKTSLGDTGSALWLMRWARNAAKNYSIISRATGIRWLADACKGIPAFVVGVGPSLDADAAKLVAAQGRSIIVATDAAVRALLARNVKPDLVVSYDAQDIQCRLWETVTEKIPALLSTCSHPTTVSSWLGPVLFYNQWHQQDEFCRDILPGLFPHIGQIPSGGTVGNMALLAAHALGCGPIFCVGMDFCYQKDEKDAWCYRAQDFRYGHFKLDGPDGWVPTTIKQLYDNDDRLRNSRKAVNPNGDEVLTDRELTMSLEAFGTIMAHFKVPVVNCTPNGMIPKSFPRLTLDQAIENHCKVELQPGRHVLKHLGRIVEDPRGEL